MFVYFLCYNTNVKKGKGSEYFPKDLYLIEWLSFPRIGWSFLLVAIDQAVLQETVVQCGSPQRKLCSLIDTGTPSNRIGNFGAAHSSCCQQIYNSKEDQGARVEMLCLSGGIWQRLVTEDWMLNLLKDITCFCIFFQGSIRFVFSCMAFQSFLSNTVWMHVESTGEEVNSKTNQ